MSRDRGFEEVMIVNPFDPRSNQQHTTLMRFHEAPEMGYYGEQPEMGYYGYYAEPPPEIGYYGQAPEMGYYAEPPEVGYYAQAPEMGYYGEPPEVGYYAQAPEMGYYGEAPEMGYYAHAPQAYGYYGEPAEMGYAEGPEMGWYGEPEVAEYAEPIEYYAEENPMAGYGYGYAEMPEMVGYGYGEYQPLSEEYPGVSEYGEPDMAGYVREARPTYNPGCPIPTNVAGYGESSPLEGYVRPGTGNPSCDNFVPQPGASSAVPDTFRPLW